MSLKIYLDDCAFSYELRRLLLDAGHQVQVPLDVEPSLLGAKDEIHFAHVRATEQVILTYNPSDFLDLHQLYPEHSGVLAVYFDNDPSRDMVYTDIVRAIDNILQIDVEIAGKFWPLNQYKW